jgi:RluA family pseudouridine synthase
MARDSEMPPPTRLTVSARHAGLRADEYLALELPFLSRTRVKQKIMTGESLLNGRRYASSARLKEGDEIAISWRRVPEDPSAPPLPMLFEDDHILAVDKPAGMPSHPSGGFQSGTAIQSVRWAYRARIRAGLERGDPGFYPRLVNRLDARTSGILLVAKRREALAAMQDLLSRGEVRRRYIAVVEGIVSPDRGRIELPLGRDGSGAISIKMAPLPGGLPCVTEYEVVEKREAHTLLRVFPKTGRQHQVRAHLAAIGHPVWGDLIYRDEALFLRYWEGRAADETLPPRHLLHADRLRFRHPFTGARTEIIAPLPERIFESLA